MRRVRRSTLILMALVLLSLFGSWLSFGLDVHVPPFRPFDVLIQERTMWIANKPSHYQMWISLKSPNMVGKYRIRVENYQVVSIEDGYVQFCETCSLPAVNADALYRYQSVFGKFFPPTMNDLTMEKLFEFAANKLIDKPAPPLIAMCSAADIEHPRYEVAYDRDQHYITSLRYTNCPSFNLGVGLLCPAVSHCNTEIAISSLQVLK